MVFGSNLFTTNINTSKTIEEQLRTGLYRDKFDTGPSDWIVRIWQSLPQKEAGWVTEAVHQALQHELPEVRINAIATLSSCPQMAQAEILLNLAETQFELFKGLRRTTDNEQVDKGRDFVQLVASLATGSRGREFRRRVSLDPIYGLHVLASLTQQDGDWVIDNASILVNQQIDPNQTRLQIILFNFRKDEKRLTQFIEKVKELHLIPQDALIKAIKAKIKDTQLQNKLVGKLNH